MLARRVAFPLEACDAATTYGASKREKANAVSNGVEIRYAPISPSTAPSPCALVVTIPPMLLAAVGLPSSSVEYESVRP